MAPPWGRNGRVRIKSKAMLKLRKRDVKKAIEGSGGYISEIAKKLNCNWHTAKVWIDRFDLTELVKQEDECLNDLAEMKLIENIKKGDTAAIIFRLKTKGKARGYVEKVELEQINSRPVIQFINVSKLNAINGDQINHGVLEDSGID